MSREQRWFVNSPTWSPDGEYIYARRHFVKERSLGAGEIWMYHASGASDGLQVTERTGWQKDNGEPDVSPDGRYLYYSKDVTPGQTFEYNKDPNGTIYAVMRRDLVTGRERRAVSVQGGSVAPQVSPDGKTLAYIRRVRLKSALYLARPRERPRSRAVRQRRQGSAGGLGRPRPLSAVRLDARRPVDRDLGRRQDLEGRCRVRARARRSRSRRASSRRSTRRCDFRRRCIADEFPVRMLRDVRVSPDGKTGRLQRAGQALREAAAGRSAAAAHQGRAARVLPVVLARRPVDRLRHVDGRRDGPRPRRAPRRRRRPRRGHAAGALRRAVVLARRPEDRLPSRRRRSDPRSVLRRARPASTSCRPPAASRVLVRDSGADPEFDHTGTRDLPARSAQREVHAAQRRRAGRASPSCRAATRSSTSAATTPRSSRRRPTASGSRSRSDSRPSSRRSRAPAVRSTSVRRRRPIRCSACRAMPASICTGPATAAVSTGRSARSCSRATSRDTFAFAPAPALQPPAREERARGQGHSDRVHGEERQAVGIASRSSAPASSRWPGSKPGPIAGTPGVIENATILVEDNRIVAVGPVGFGSGARRARGASTSRARRSCPGSSTSTAIVGGESSGLLAQSSWPLAANLAFGVTTSHDPSNDTETVFTNAELIRSGAKLGPRLFSTGTILYGAETPFKAVVESYEDALSHLRRQKAVGAFSVKSYNQQRRDARQMIIKAARELEMMVVPEGGSLLYMNETHVLDGHTGVEHSLPVPRIYKDMVQLFAKSKSGYTPTLIVGYGGLSGEYYWYQHTNVWENEQLLRFTPREVVDARSRRRTMAPEDDFNHVLIAQGREADRRCRRLGAARRARAAAGARRALGAVDAAAGRDDADGGAARGDDRRRALSRARRRPRLAREGQARRPDRARSQSAREHPATRSRWRW